MRNVTLLILLLACSWLARSQGIRGYSPDANGVLYVNAAAVGDAAGDGWENAIVQLSVALRVADSLNDVRAGWVTQIWVAKGTYKPLYSAENGHREEDGGRNNAFVFIKDVKIYGGFAGTETSLNQRDIHSLFTANRTVLSGDIGVDAAVSDNAYHVVIAAGDIGVAGLDGFVISGGHADDGSKVIWVNGSLFLGSDGGGLSAFGSDPVISHCFFTGNNAVNGGAMYFTLQSAPAIMDCIISENSAVYGGAMYNADSYNFKIKHTVFSDNEATYGGGAIYDTSSAIPMFTSCRFTGNSAQKGGVVYNCNSSDAYFTNGIFSGNSAGQWGGAVYSNFSHGSYVGCLFSGNMANYGGAFNCDNGAGPYIVNCTIAGNLATAQNGGGGIRIYNSTPDIVNTIIWRNSDGISNAQGKVNKVSHSIVQLADVAGQGTGNSNKDPLFIKPVDASYAPTLKGNYGVAANSPVFEKGTNQLPAEVSLPDTDLIGNARVMGSLPDMGAYEIQGYVPDKKGVFYVNKNVSGGNGTGDSWTNAFKELSDALLIARQINEANPGIVKQIWVAKGTYHPLYNAADGHRTEDDKQALDGTIYPSNNAFVLLGHVKLYGGFKGTETSPDQRNMDSAALFKANATVLDGQSVYTPKGAILKLYKQSYHVVIASDIDSTSLDGFVVRNGRASGYGLIVVNGRPVMTSSGAGMFDMVSGVSVSHCEFSNNVNGAMYSSGGTVSVSHAVFNNNPTTTNGAAMQNHAVILDVTDCHFNNNSVNGNANGGAIYNSDIDASSSITHCFFSGNLITAQGRGGGIYNDNASPQILDCVFNDNNILPVFESNAGGAIYNFESSPTISHCTFNGNTAGYGGGIYNENASADILNCTFTGNKASYEDADHPLSLVGNGGAIYNNNASCHIVNNSFINNEANGTGGAIKNYESSKTLIAGCFFSGNKTVIRGISLGIGHAEYFSQGDAIYNESSSDVAIINCTIIARDTSDADVHLYAVDNYSNASADIVNSIVWGNDLPPLFGDNGSKFNVSYSIVQMPSGSVYDGDGNLNRDPRFMNPAQGKYQLNENSPAIAAGTNSVAQYRLPDADLAGNPRVVGGKINMGAFGSTFIHPNELVAKYDTRDTITVTWKAILHAGESYVGGDDFKLERSTDSTFQHNVKIVTSSLHYDPKKTDYSIPDDITDISGGLRVYYRLTRTSAQNQDWQIPAYGAVNIFIDTLLEGIQADTVSAPGKSPMAVITWKPFTGVWTQGTQFNLIKKNTTEGTQETISITEDSARAGHYTDDNIPTCKRMTYTISVKLGNHFASPPDADIPGHVLTKELAAISGLTASKGYYPDRTSLRWTAQGTYDHYVIKRKVYGSSDDYLQVATIDGAGLKELQEDDDKGTPGVYYQYMVTGLTQCDDATLHSNAIEAIGFRSPTGTVYGRVTYQNGGGAVQNATVRMESGDDTQLGRSVHLDGEPGSHLVIDSLFAALSDTAFTVSVWIKPDDAQPRNQVVFAREGQYLLGFDGQGRLYFDYNGERITGSYYTPDTTDGWVHIAAVHQKDSLMLMISVNDTIAVDRKAIAHEAAGYASDRVFIGSDSDGSNFKGSIDEMRLWNVARDSAQITKDYTRLLTGGETGLVAYWRFDATIKDRFYDISHHGENYNGNDGEMDSLHVMRSAIIPSTDKLSLKAYTDSTGNYTITGIPYTGINGTTYSVAPRLGTHVFDPVAVTRIFSSGSNTFTLDFKDKSSYIISGHVAYQHTAVPVQGVQFKIDGNYAFTGNGTVAQTGENGEFSISVPVGVHTVQAVKANHVFTNMGEIQVDGMDVNYQQNLSGISIYDSTTIRFIGRVAGGAIEANYPLGFSLSKNILGEVIAITLKSKGDYFLNDKQTPVIKYYRHVVYSDQQKGPVELPDSTKVEYEQHQIVIYPDTATGEFEADLIPADFIIASVDVSNGAISVLANQTELNLTDSLIPKTQTYTHTDTIVHADGNTYSTYNDTAKYNASYIFSYRTDPVIAVTQSINPGNPNAVGYFGDTTYLYNTMDGSEATIPLYDNVTGQYTFGHPVFMQNVQYGMKITAYEPYPYYHANGTVRDTAFVPSEGGVVTVTNELKSGSVSPDTAHLSEEGIAYDAFYGGEPSFADSALKGFAVSVQIGSQTYQWNQGKMYKAYVFGGKQTGTDFVTEGPDNLIGILRDPPGSDSYAYLDKGFTTSTIISTTTSLDDVSSIEAIAHLGNEQTTFMGTPVVKVKASYKVTNDISLTAIVEAHQHSNHTTNTSITIDNRFATSNDPSFDGASDDIFIGNSTNLTFGTTVLLAAVPNDKVKASDSIFFKGSTYSIVKHTGFNIGQRFKTLFAYPQYFIISDLIPNLAKLRNNILSEGSALSDPQATANAEHREIYVSKVNNVHDHTYGSSNTDKSVWGSKTGPYNDGPSYKIFFPEYNKDGTAFNQYKDSIADLNDEINQWKVWLSKNEEDKVNADYTSNYSFGAGASIDNTTQSNSTESHEAGGTIVLGGAFLNDLGFQFNKTGFEIKVNAKVTHSEDNSTIHDTARSTTIGYHLEENGSNYMSVSVGDDPNDFPVFQTKGGVTACPYEGPTETQYYNQGTALNQPTVQREMPQIRVTSKPVVTGVAANRAASYTLSLWNASEVKGDIYFGLDVIDKSNPYGAKIYLDGTPLGNGRTLLIPAGETLTKTLTVEKGPDSMSYDNLEIVLHSTCQYNPVVYAYNIADTATISARFLPACSDIHLSSPTDQWLINTLSPETVVGNDTMPYLPVVLDQYDVNKQLFDHIELQYKPATSPDWVTTMKFYTDSAAYKNDRQGGAKTVIQSPDKTKYNFLMNNTFADGQYDIRALSVCMDNGQSVAETPSNTVSGIKDTYRPRPFGNPLPVNGILGLGQNAGLTFNEPIDIGYLNQQPPYVFFTVKGVKNGTAIDSTVAIQLDGLKDAATTEFNKNMTGKDFTVSMWFLPDSKAKGTLFSQGDKNNSIELGLTADYHLRAIMGNQVMTSADPMAYLPGQWVHAALVYHEQDSTLSIFYNYAKVLPETKTLGYDGIGPFIFGKSLKNDGDFFAGKMRNVRVWTTPLTSIKLQENSVKILSGDERHLLACYPMDESKGNILFDKAHGNNATFTGTWKMPEGRSVAFNGDGHIRLNTSQAVITPEMDFTLGLWFKAAPGQTDAALISSGKGDGSDPGSSRNLYTLGFEEGKLTFTNNEAKEQIDDNYLDNNWHHVVIAANRNTGTAQWYVDGELKKFFDAGNLGGLASTYTYLGARAFHQAPDSTVTYFDQYFKGDIDEVRIWNTYLNSTLVTKGGNTRLSGKETGLLAYYPFEKHTLSSSNIWSTTFTLADQKIQQDPNNHVPDAASSGVTESMEKAPMKDPGPVQDLAYDFVANHDALVFNFTGGTDEMKAIDKTIVTFSAANIRDLHGNYLASPVTWTAYIDQNPLKWGDESLNLAKDLYKPMQFESYIVNSGGSEENFKIGNLSPWLSADITSGTIPPEGKQKITFTINEGLNVGAYDDVIEMTNDLQETQGLVLNLKVNGEKPAWKVNPADYKYNMSIYGKLRIDHIFSHDPEDMLAAFVNGKCVGMTNNIYLAGKDLWYTLLTVYGNAPEEEDNITFRIWDASTGKIYEAMPSESIKFTSNDIIGTSDNPVIFDGEEMLFQNIMLNKGWNWISFNLYNTNLTQVNTALANGKWMSGDMVKHDLAGFDQYSSSAGWVGTLPELNNTSLFKLKTGTQQVLSTSGTRETIDTMHIIVQGGRWNYISYLPQVNMTVTEALADYQATDQDVLKSQTGFTMYSARNGWIGNLTYLEPGEGYMLYRKGSATTKFVYPVISGSLNIHRQSGNSALASARLNPLQSPVENNYQYAENMTVLAKADKSFTLMPGDKILAYAGIDVRGEALPVENPVAGSSAFFFNISGKTMQPVHFEVERNGKMVAQTAPVISYAPDRMIGSLGKPFMLHFGKPEIKTGIFPNPFHDAVTVTVNLTPGKHTLQMMVCDATGKRVISYQKQTVNAQYYHTNWNGRDERGTVCSAGIYFIHLLVDGKSKVYKLVKQ